VLNNIRQLAREHVIPRWKRQDKIKILAGIFFADVILKHAKMFLVRKMAGIKIFARELNPVRAAPLHFRTHRLFQHYISRHILALAEQHQDVSGPGILRAGRALSKAVQPADQGQNENDNENWPGLPDRQRGEMSCEIQALFSLSFRPSPSVSSQSVLQSCTTSSTPLTNLLNTSLAALPSSHMSHKRLY
jgi:hypothetical protein